MYQKPTSARASAGVAMVLAVASARRYCLVLASALILQACASTSTSTDGPQTTRPQHDNLYATLYLQSASEYKALSRAVYRSAESMLDAALADPGWRGALEQQGDVEGLAPGIIFDVDETVLDNSPYQATLVSRNIRYTTPHWDRWVAEAKAEAVPGAVAFSRAAAARGITLLYLTNRRCIQRVPDGDDCPQRQETIDNLVRAGFPAPDPAHVYLRSAELGFERDKRSRREAFASRFWILMLFGDDLGDFLPGVKEEGITPDQRDTLVGQYEQNWGRSWFILPNPSYGSWLDILGDDPGAYLRPWQDRR